MCKPLEPFTTSVNEVPSKLYCHLLNVRLSNLAVNVIVEGSYVSPFIEVNIWDVAWRLSAFASSPSKPSLPSVPLVPLVPAVPCLAHDQLNVLLNVLSSIVIGIVNCPLSAPNIVEFDTAKFTLLDVLVTVIPLALGIFPIL